MCPCRSDNSSRTCRYEVRPYHRRAEALPHAPIIPASPDSCQSSSAGLTPCPTYLSAYCGGPILLTAADSCHIASAGLRPCPTYLWCLLRLNPCPSRLQGRSPAPRTCGG